MTSAYDRNKEPATDEHTRREGSLREEAGERGERGPGAFASPALRLPAGFPASAAALVEGERLTESRIPQSRNIPDARSAPPVEEKPGVCSTGKGEEIVCSNGEPVFVDEITGKPIALNVLLKSL